MKNKRILIVGGTGSLGNKLISFLRKNNRLIIFSRDEEKQWQIRNQYRNVNLKFVIGDIRDYDSIHSALVLHRPQIVINAAALKQIDTCEYFPYQSIKTNILGIQNVVDAVVDVDFVHTVIGVSTDKACKPVNVYGMCKAIQERVYVEANLSTKHTRFLCVRYGNVLESRGSVIPLFKQQVEKGGPVTITLPEMTRFLLTLEQSVRLILTAYKEGLPGDTWIPRTISGKITDIADLVIGSRKIPIKQIGIRPGEKIHEILISEEEVFRTRLYKDHYIILPVLPEVQKGLQRKGSCRTVSFHEYSSKDVILSKSQLKDLLVKNHVL